eukprot:GHRQ01036875.1.p2 GENE.GHRQ01036875.1~~GHRQ01036875.1.p2  ORF type:complete len:110 (-),score=54.02 GHRQ01036875.1:249-578(-)
MSAASAAAAAHHQVPSFRDISSSESLLGAPNIADNLLPMRILPLEQTVCSPGHLRGLLGAYKGSRYLLALQPAQSIPWWDVQVRASVVEVWSRGRLQACGAALTSTAFV